jgi:superfamily II DNA or RNA helicase
MSFAVGALVRARDREWVVLPESDDDVLLVRPLGGTDDESTGICLSLERVQPATFGLPDATQLGDWRSCRLLRDAVRLGFRSSAGPFRSFAKLGVEPRPYQLVPLLMALKLDPVRMLIADDVGIGKTVEACLVARELIDRGEVNRMAVLCPPHLAEQWQRELKDKFHLDMELVLSSTASRLERQCPAGKSLFEVFPFVVVSMDFIKSDRRHDEFLRTCPELVIIDEAHTCAFAAAGRGGRHQRHHLVKSLATNQERHMLLVTATPHSGNEQAFRSLLGLLNPDFAGLPEDLSGRENEQQRRRLAQYFIQRRRGDIRHYLQADTPFPDREEREDSYRLSADYKRLFAKVLNYARETVADTQGGKHRQRVRWWSALALLRSLASSPAAAAATLRNRAAPADAETVEEVDDIGERSVLDLTSEEVAETIDVSPGADAEEEPANENTATRRKLLEMAREADALQGSKDEKLLKAIKLIKELVKDGFQPLIFCRFIDTATYVAAQLRESLPSDVEISAVTGLLPPAEREQRVALLAQHEKRVLVCTDCLSEGINLQSHFNAVMHYDLSWNPTRHEQREGRVDRYGQPRKIVRVLTYYGIDNQIDGIVLDILIKKHKSIRTSLGISVPVPVESEKVIEAIFEGLLLRGRRDFDASQLQLFNADALEPVRKQLHRDWETVADREKRSRTMFAQETIKVDDVARELAEVQAAIGSGVDVARFTQEALSAHLAVVSPKPNSTFAFDLTHTPPAVRDALSIAGIAGPTFIARFELPVDNGVVHLPRTHPVVEKLAAHVMENALDATADSIARRCGVIRSSRVPRRTTLLLLRLRYQIITIRDGVDHPLLAEDCLVVGFTGSPEQAQWCESATIESLLTTEPDSNVNPDSARDFVQQVINGYGLLESHLRNFAEQRGRQLLDSHTRVHQATRTRGVQTRVEPKLPPDILGIYVYLPVPRL